MSTNTVSNEELAERVRMALAEAGYPDASVVVADSAVDKSVPIEIAWRAWQVAGAESNCLACCTADPRGYKRRGDCRGVGLYQLDCGADRSGW